MIALGESQQAIDLVTLTESLHRTGELESSGGAPYLAALADGMPRVSNVEHYARIVREKALLRNLIHATHNIQQRALEGEDAPTRFSTVPNLPSSPSPRTASKLASFRSRTSSATILSAWKNLPRRQKHHRRLHRLHRARQASFRLAELRTPHPRRAPLEGKTALALNLAENISIRAQQPVAIFSLEMSKESLQRLVASVAQIDAHKFRTGHLSREDWRRMTEALARSSSAPLWIDDAGSTSVLEIGAKARRLKRDKGLSLLVVDYLQLITARAASGVPPGGNLRCISRGLKGLAKELQIPVLVPVPAHPRAGTAKSEEPELSDLRESGAIEQDADVVMFVYRPHWAKLGASPEERDQAEIQVAKQRNGPTDKVRFVFRSRLTRFEEAAPDAFSQFAPDDM